MIKKKSISKENNDKKINMFKTTNSCSSLSKNLKKNVNISKDKIIYDNSSIKANNFSNQSPTSSSIKFDMNIKNINFNYNDSLDSDLRTLKEIQITNFSKLNTAISIVDNINNNFIRDINNKKNLNKVTEIIKDSCNASESILSKALSYCSSLKIIEDTLLKNNNNENLNNVNLIDIVNITYESQKLQSKIEDLKSELNKYKDKYMQIMLENIDFKSKLKSIGHDVDNNNFNYDKTLSCTNKSSISKKNNLNSSFNSINKIKSFNTYANLNKFNNNFADISNIKTDVKIPKGINNKINTISNKKPNKINTDTSVVYNANANDHNKHRIKSNNYNYNNITSINSLEELFQRLNNLLNSKYQQEGEEILSQSRSLSTNDNKSKIKLVNNLYNIIADLIFMSEEINVKLVFYKENFTKYKKFNVNKDKIMLHKTYFINNNNQFALISDPNKTYYEWINVNYSENVKLLKYISEVSDVLKDLSKYKKRCQILDEENTKIKKFLIQEVEFKEKEIELLLNNKNYVNNYLEQYRAIELSIINNKYVNNSRNKYFDNSGIVTLIEKDNITNNSDNKFYYKKKNKLFNYSNYIDNTKHNIIDNRKIKDCKSRYKNYSYNIVYNNVKSFDNKNYRNYSNDYNKECSLIDKTRSILHNENEYKTNYNLSLSCHNFFNKLNNSKYEYNNNRISKFISNLLIIENNCFSICSNVIYLNNCNNKTNQVQLDVDNISQNIEDSIKLKSSYKYACSTNNNNNNVHCILKENPKYCKINSNFNNNIRSNNSPSYKIDNNLCNIYDKTNSSINTKIYIDKHTNTSNYLLKSLLDIQLNICFSIECNKNLKNVIDNINNNHNITSILTDLNSFYKLNKENQNKLLDSNSDPKGLGKKLIEETQEYYNNKIIKLTSNICYLHEVINKKNIDNYKTNNDLQNSIEINLKNSYNESLNKHNNYIESKNYKEENSNLMKNINELSNELKDLNELKDELLTKNKELSHQSSKLENSILNKENELNEQMKHMLILKNNVANFEQQKINMNDVIHNLKSKIKDHESKFEQLNKEYSISKDYFDKEILQKDAIINNLNNNINLLESEKSKYLKYIEEKNSNIKDLETKNNEYIINIDSMNKELNSIKTENYNLNTQLKESKEITDNLNKNNSILNNEITILKINKNELEGNLKNISNNHKEKLNNEIKDLNIALNEKTIKIKELKIEIKNLSNYNEEIIQKNDDLEYILKEEKKLVKKNEENSIKLNNVIKENNNKINNLNSNINNFQELFKSLNEEKINFINNLNTKDKLIEDLTIENKNINQLYENIQIKLKDIQNKDIIEFENIIKDLNKVNNILKDENNTYKKEILNLNKQLNENADKFHNEINNYQNVVLNKDKEIEDLKIKSDNECQINKKNEHYFNLLSDKEIVINNLNLEAENYIIQKNVLDSKVESLNMEIDSLNNVILKNEENFNNINKINNEKILNMNTKIIDYTKDIVELTNKLNEQEYNNKELSKELEEKNKLIKDKADLYNKLQNIYKKKEEEVNELSYKNDQQDFEIENLKTKLRVYIENEEINNKKFIELNNKLSKVADQKRLISEENKEIENNYNKLSETLTNANNLLEKKNILIDKLQTENSMYINNTDSNYNSVCENALRRNTNNYTILNNNSLTYFNREPVTSKYSSSNNIIKFCIDNNKKNIDAYNNINNTDYYNNNIFINKSKTCKLSKKRLETNSLNKLETQDNNSNNNLKLTFKNSSNSISESISFKARKLNNNYIFTTTNNNKQKHKSKSFSNTSYDIFSTINKYNHDNTLKIINTLNYEIQSSINLNSIENFYIDKLNNLSKTIEIKNANINTLKNCLFEFKNNLNTSFDSKIKNQLYELENINTYINNNNNDSNFNYSFINTKYKNDFNSKRSLFKNDNADCNNNVLNSCLNDNNLSNDGLINSKDLIYDNTSESKKHPKLINDKNNDFNDNNYSDNAFTGRECEDIMNDLIIDDFEVNVNNNNNNNSLINENKVCLNSKIESLTKDLNKYKQENVNLLSHNESLQNKLNDALDQSSKSKVSIL